MVSVQFGSGGYLFSVVGTSRCDVRAACSGATPSIANVARIFVPPALPSRSTRTLHRMEERAGEGRSVKLPLSSVLSPLLRHGARKKRGGPENLRKSTSCFSEGSAFARALAATNGVHPSNPAATV